MARIAFYAPLKPPDHPVPSGDRRIARLFVDALTQAGHHVRVVSALRSYDGAGDPSVQKAIAAAGRTAVTQIVREYRAPSPDAPEAPGNIWQPDLWFTYHLYHKAPDHLGPAVCKALNLPYLVAEASYAPKQAEGPWRDGHRAVADALAAADHVVFLNPADRECVMPLLRTGAGTTDLKPFLDTGPFLAAARDRSARRDDLAAGLVSNDRSVILLAVGMMRLGDKLSSYRLLAAALTKLRQPNWTLIIVGDGPARSEVQTAFADLSDKVHFFGDRSVSELPEIYAGADICVWPAIGEAIGMAVLESICSGTPAVAGAAGSLVNIVLNEHSGKLTPLGNVEKFAAAIDELIADPEERMRLSQGAVSQAEDHDIGNAASVLNLIVRDLVGEVT